ncbi:MAG: hypothetical protein A4E49_02172 [Methanosaeta sp. PtaU1.Bin112]|nr:MAG: hypothetical protein A4E49_02172 [Methanosaeta sp. PtaU1.Bin112]
MAMDHVVHINNGSGAAKPIILRLLPGEEMIFNLKVLNDGEPSNISLLASSPVFNAVRLKKPDHYVVLEETIPVLARMPADKKRLDGEILLTSSGGESKVPITLLRDSEDPGDDLEDPGLQGDEELRDYEADEDDEDLDPADRLSAGRDRDFADDEAIDDDDEYVHESIRRRKGEKEEDDLDDEGEETEKEPRRISFSRDKDLQRYRSSRQRKAAGTAESREEGRLQKPAKRRMLKDRADTDEAENRYNGNINADGEDEDDDSIRIKNSSRSRIDDRFVDPDSRPDEVPRFISRQVPSVEPEEWKKEQVEARAEEWAEERTEEQNEERKRPTSGYEDRYRSFSQGFEGDMREGPLSPSEAEADRQEGRTERDHEGPEPYVEQNEEPESIYLERLGSFGGMGSIKVVPVVLFLALVIVLVMTFITLNIPEFPGALASSILIVTLIIYGAATLLKA